MTYPVGMSNLSTCGLSPTIPDEAPLNSICTIKSHNCIFGMPFGCPGIVGPPRVSGILLV